MAERPPVLALAALLSAAACAPAVPAPPVPAGNECVAVDDSARSRITIGIADAVTRGFFDDPVTGAQLYETLVRVDCADRVIPGLAVRWSSGNGREWRFRIREGLSFSDGTPVNARSVAAALPPMPLLAGISVPGEYDLSVLLDDPADVRLFARRDLAVRRTADTGIAAGTGAWVPLRDSPGYPLQLVARSSRERSAGRASGGTPDTLVVHLFGSDPRTAIDAGVDLLVTHDAATIAYARARSGYIIAPLTWSSTYVLATTDAGAGTADVPLDAFPAALVGAASRPAQPPFWWAGCRGIPDSGDPSATVSAGSTSIPASGRILFLRDDPVARAIAERVSALARGRAPEWLPGRLAVGGAPAAAGVGRAELLAALEDGNALAVVAAIRRVEHGGCHARPYAPLLTRWHVTPLIDTRDALIHRSGIGRLVVDADGTLRFDAR